MTKKGYNPERVKKTFEALKTKLNDHELCLLTDLLVWDKKILIKTVNLVIRDLEVLEV